MFHYNRFCDNTSMIIRDIAGRMCKCEIIKYVYFSSIFFLSINNIQLKEIHDLYHKNEINEKKILLRDL